MTLPSAVRMAFGRISSTQRVDQRSIRLSVAGWLGDPSRLVGRRIVLSPGADRFGREKRVGWATVLAACSAMEIDGSGVEWPMLDVLIDGQLSASVPAACAGDWAFAVDDGGVVPPLSEEQARQGAEWSAERERERQAIERLNEVANMVPPVAGLPKTLPGAIKRAKEALAHKRHCFEWLRSKAAEVDAEARAIEQAVAEYDAEGETGDG